MMTSRVHTPEDVKKIQRQWVDLTPADFENLEQLYGNKVANDFVLSDIICTVESKLKEKNNG